MPALFRRQSNIQCFFCQSPLPIPANIRNFKCSSCGCWNRYDERGEIISDEPAMHQEHLNSKSFAKRASPRKDVLPTMYGPGPFCHSCQTNQMLIINLLSNYLPEPESPEYESRLEMLPAYRESLHIRYPPVCESCLPQVEEEIRRKDQMARVKALGGYLSKGKERKRRVSGGPNMEAEKLAFSKKIFWWRIRGALWTTTLCVSTIGAMSGGSVSEWDVVCVQLMSDNLEAAYDYHPFRPFSFLHPILPLLIGVSLLWTAWDPTYATFLKARLQGRDVRIHGKRTYNVLQMLAWTIRMCSAMLLSALWFRPHIISSDIYRLYFITAAPCELFTIVTAYYVLRIQQPPSIRLVDTHAHLFDKSRSGTPNPESQATSPTTAGFPKPPPPTLDPDALLSLSLSSQPVISKPKHVFGFPSLQGSTSMQHGPATKEEHAEDEMDWTPTNPEASTSHGKRAAPAESDNNSWLRPQRFFAPEKPTGLEGLFENTRLQDEPMPLQSDTRWSDMSLSRIFTNHLRKWAPLYTLILGVLVASLAYTFNWLGLARPASLSSSTLN
ncbi:hypothetical protein CVT26_002047 [Gymnopilus dilepis]|uniref:Ima1 N-terminal domain-containing protein n=1 Tax=Gymnopilus dilepis TaxID=231916 RepID=A0A409VBW9_9AGAR|nr:hypothetical protein CVT26_002047 [Gymnopilus dilepis]